MIEDSPSSDLNANGLKKVPVQQIKNFPQTVNIPPLKPAVDKAKPPSYSRVQ